MPWILLGAALSSGGLLLALRRAGRVRARAASEMRPLTHGGEAAEEDAEDGETSLHARRWGWGGGRGGMRTSALTSTAEEEAAGVDGASPPASPRLPLPLSVPTVASLLAKWEAKGRGRQGI